MRVEVKPELLRWARRRSRKDPGALYERFPRLAEWESGEAQPTLRQLEEFARYTHTPVGFLFLPEPPVEQVPIPDCRTVGSQGVRAPSPDLLDTLYLCQQRQEWYRDHARLNGAAPLPFVGSATTDHDVVATAAAMRQALRFDLAERRALPSWTEALRRFADQADALGVLVMASGIVGSNAHRPLDPDEFRGFTLADPLAPLVFINAADTKAAQMFTLAHELAHVWLGESALTDAGPASDDAVSRVEVWCNAVAAELLVPLAAVREAFRPDAPAEGEIARLARQFKVSTLVVLRRIHDAGGLTREQLRERYAQEVARLRAVPQTTGGGDFYRTLGVRVGRRFTRALVGDALEGGTLHRDAFRLLGVSKVETFHELAAQLGLR